MTDICIKLIIVIHSEVHMKDQEEYLRQFMPYCLMLITQPSKGVLIKLHKLCDETSPTKLQNLQDSILFPMQIYLKTATLLERYNLALIDFVSFFLRNVSSIISSSCRIFSSVSSYVWICCSPEARPVS